VKWIELYEIAAEVRCDQFALDTCVRALADSRNASLHAWVAAEVPTERALCAALDAHGVPVSGEVEAQVAMRCGFARLRVTSNNDEQTSQVLPTLGPSQSAVA